MNTDVLTEALDTNPQTNLLKIQMIELQTHITMYKMKSLSCFELDERKPRFLKEQLRGLWCSINV